MSDDIVNEAADEIERLRAELADARLEIDAGRKDNLFWRQDVDALRAELAAEREQREFADEALTATYLTGVADGKEQMQAERDALRALLKEALDYIDDPYDDLAISIGAALNKGGGDE